MAAMASRRLRELQAQPGNKTCVDCAQKNPQWASVSYSVFMCFECFDRGKATTAPGVSVRPPDQHRPRRPSSLLAVADPPPTQDPMFRRFISRISSPTAESSSFFLADDFEAVLVNNGCFMIHGIDGFVAPPPPPRRPRVLHQSSRIPLPGRSLLR